MVDQVLRPYKEQFLKPATAVLKTVSPSKVTVVALLFGLVAALTAFLGWPLVAVAFWLLNRVLDGLDGELARLTEQQTDWGGYLDIMVDYVVYAAIPLALAARSPAPFVTLSALFMLATFYVNTASWMYLSALLEKRGRGSVNTGERTSVTMPSGLIEGTETIVFYTFFCLLPAQSPYLFLTMAILSVVTVFQRVSWARRHFSQTTQGAS